MWFDLMRHLARTCQVSFSSFCRERKPATARNGLTGRGRDTYNLKVRGWRDFRRKGLSGNSSVVECDLAKVEVAGSNPVSRSNFEAPRILGAACSATWGPFAHSASHARLS